MQVIEGLHNQQNPAKKSMTRHAITTELETLIPDQNECSVYSIFFASSEAFVTVHKHMLQKCIWRSRKSCVLLTMLCTCPAWSMQAAFIISESCVGSVPVLDGPQINTQISHFRVLSFRANIWFLLFSGFWKILVRFCFFHLRSSVAGWGPREEHFHCEHRPDWTAGNCVRCHQYHPWTSNTWKWCNPSGLSHSAHTYSQIADPTRKEWKWGEIRGEQV